MKKLYRSVSDRKLAGICGGLGEYLEVDPTLIRLAVAIAAVMTAIFPFVILYIAGIFIIPEEGHLNEHVKDAPPSST